MGPPGDGEGQERRGRALCLSCRVSDGFSFLSWSGEITEACSEGRKPRPETETGGQLAPGNQQEGLTGSRVSERAFPPPPSPPVPSQQHKAPESGQYELPSQGLLVKPTRGWGWVPAPQVAARCQHGERSCPSGAPQRRAPCHGGQMGCPLVALPRAWCLVSVGQPLGSFPVQSGKS